MAEKPAMLNLAIGNIKHFLVAPYVVTLKEMLAFLAGVEI